MARFDRLGQTKRIADFGLFRLGKSQSVRRHVHATDELHAERHVSGEKLSRSSISNPDANAVVKVVLGVASDVREKPATFDAFVTHDSAPRSTYRDFVVCVVSRQRSQRSLSWAKFVEDGPRHGSMDPVKFDHDRRTFFDLGAIDPYDRE